MILVEAIGTRCIEKALQPGAYTIEATTYDAKATGNFTLTIAAVKPASPTETPTTTSTPTRTPTRTVSAWLFPNPESVDFTDDADEWHEFRAHVHSGVPVYMSVSIKGEKDLIEHSTKNNRRAKCKDRENIPIEHGDKFYLAACDEGTATVELLTGTTNIIRTYHIPIGDTAPRARPTRTHTPTYTPTPTPTATSVSGATPPRTHTPTPTATKTSTTDECPSDSASGSSMTSTFSSCQVSLPPKPTGLTSTYDDSEITLDWDDMSNVDSYEIWERKLQNNKWSDWMKLPSLTPITTSAAYIPGLTNGVQYEHVVVSKRGLSYSDWSDTVTTGLLHRQSDHVARFHLRNASNMSSDFRTAIPTAVAAWETAITRHGDGNLVINICKKGAGNCNSKNIDGYLITVKSVAGNINNTKDVYDPRYAPYKDCGDKIACVKTTNPRTYGTGSTPVYNFLSYGTPLHLKDLTLIVEDPAYEVYRDSKMRVLGNSEFSGGIVPNTSMKIHTLPRYVRHRIYRKKLAGALGITFPLFRCMNSVMRWD